VTSPSIAPETRIQVSPSVYVRAFGQELVLLDFSRGEYFGLDETGAAIWRGLEAGKPLGEIADTLVERYDVARDVAYDDIVALVIHREGQSLITLF
jgi:Coenzyme PQQ synthesis protein D (PqqD)